MEVSVLEETLNNGLKIIGEVNPLAKSAALGFFVCTGSRDESTKEAGISHFLEHMMFKGTKKRSALEITYALGNMAAKANAYTSEESTVYYAAVLPEYFRDLKELLCDMLRPALDPSEFEVEKKVILEEIALYKDKPHYFLFERMFAEYYSGHPAGNSVLGSTESISAVSQPEMLDYFDRRYAPSNITVVASGNFDWTDLVADITKYCGQWNGPKAERTLRTFTPVPQIKKYTKKDLNQAHCALLAPAPSDQDPERFPMAVLAAILGDTVGSKLYWELIDKGLAETAEADLDDRQDTGNFMTFVSSEPKDLDDVLVIVRKILSKPDDFTEQELERAKTKIITRMVLSGESTMGRMRSLGHEWLSHKRIHNLGDHIEAIRSVDRRQIQGALNKFPLNEWSEFRLVPE